MHLRSNRLDTTMDETNPEHTNWLQMIFSCLEQTRVQQEKQHIERMETLNTIKTQQKDILSKISTLNEKPTSNLPTTTKTQPNPNSCEQIQAEWNKLLNARKHAFYNSIRSTGIISIYEDLINQDDPIIPPKFREKQFPGQTEAHTKRLKTLEISKVKIDIERLSEHANKQQEIINNVESQIKSHIYQHENVEMRQEMIALWVKQVSKEEEVSKNIWEKKRKFLTEEHSRETPYDREDYSAKPNNNHRSNPYNKTTTRNHNQPIPHYRTVPVRQTQAANVEELSSLLLKLCSNIQPNINEGSENSSNFRNRAHQQDQNK